jgi:leader peptidase (prepilin peptidase)/N-methyltransferase
MVAFSIGIFLAALGGAFTAPMISVQPGVSVGVIILSFAVVIIGGLGSIEGAAIGALAVLLSYFPIWAMLLGWQLLLLAMLDLRHMWLPRQLSALLGASGALFALVMGYWSDDLMALVMSMIGGAFGFAALWMRGQGYQMWRGQEGLGGGDPPLLGAIGLWLGPLGVIHTLLAASLLGLVVAFVLWRAGQKIAPDTMLPLGTLLAVGAWPVFLWQVL